MLSLFAFLTMCGAENENRWRFSYALCAAAPVALACAAALYYALGVAHEPALQWTPVRTVTFSVLFSSNNWGFQFQFNAYLV